MHAASSKRLVVAISVLGVGAAFRVYADPNCHQTAFGTACPKSGAPPVLTCTSGSYGIAWISNPVCNSSFPAESGRTGLTPITTAICSYTTTEYDTDTGTCVSQSGGGRNITVNCRSAAGAPCPVIPSP